MNEQKDHRRDAENAEEAQRVSGFVVKLSSWLSFTQTNSSKSQASLQYISQTTRGSLSSRPTASSVQLVRGVAVATQAYASARLVASAHYRTHSLARSAREHPHRPVESLLEL